MMTWIILAIAIPLIFLLSGLETALLSASRVRLIHHQKEGTNKRAKRLADLYFNDRDHLLTCILILLNTLTILVFAAVTQKLVSRFGDWGYGLTFVYSLPLYFIFAELLPKALFKRFPFRLLLASVPLLNVISVTLMPLVKGVAFILGVRRKSETAIAEPESDPAVSRQEFKTFANLVEKAGVLGSDERQMIENIVDFQDITASDVMIPMSRVTAVPPDMPIQSVLSVARQHGIDQFPVMSKTGGLVGLVNVYEVLRSNSRKGRVINYVRKLVRADPDDPALAIVRRLRRDGIQLAGVFSKTGRPLGIVSIEDMLEKMIVRPS